MKNRYCGYRNVSLSAQGSGEDKYVAFRISRPAGIVVEERISYAEWIELVKEINEEFGVLRQTEA